MVRRVAVEDEATALDTQVRVLGLAPGELDALFDSIALEWREAGRILDVRTRHVPSLTAILELAEEKRRAALRRESPQESECSEVAPQDVSPEESERLRDLSRKLSSLSRRADELASRKTEMTERHEFELAQLKRRQQAELDPVVSAYNEVLDNLLVAKDASERIAALTAQTGEAG
jgi:hypothetical protein